jgi:hypothetical protein
VLDNLVKRAPGDAELFDYLGCAQARLQQRQGVLGRLARGGLPAPTPVPTLTKAD